MGSVEGIRRERGEGRQSTDRLRLDPARAHPVPPGGPVPPPLRLAIRSDPLIGRARRVLELVFGPLSDRAFAVRFWDGTVDSPPGGRVPSFTLLLHTPSALREMLLPPTELRLGEAFVRGVFDVEGDLGATHGVAQAVPARLRSPANLVRLFARLVALPASTPAPAVPLRPATPSRWSRSHSPPRDAAAVRSHYDVGNDFYALWLDQRMVYSCAYFETGSEDIDTAQQAKLEHLCRKLRLRPGERLLDIGCGWGGLIMHAAAQYGVEAVGITLSEAQASMARQRVAAAGLADRCRVVVCDYRTLPAERQFDKIVSVGMVEHVGRSQLITYFRQAYRLLAPGGLFMNHGIVCAPTVGGIGDALGRWMWRPGTFMDRYVFPDGELMRLGETVEAAEAAGFETRDVESLREHYARTLRLWVQRLESQAHIATRLVGPQTYRVWRLYMSASAQGFASGRLNLHQILFAKPDIDGTVPLPWSRADLYATSAARS